MYDLLSHLPKNLSFITRNFKKSETILDPYQTSGCLYILVSGKAAVYNLGIDGEELNIYEYCGTDCFGEIELLCGRRYPLMVRATTDCTVYLVAKRDFLQWLKEDPGFSFFLLKRMSEKLLDNSDRMTRLSLLTMRERYLLSIYNHYNACDLDSLSKARIAEEICAPIRSLNRLVAENRELVSYGASGFQIVDEEQIHDVCEGLQDMLLLHTRS